MYQKISGSQNFYASERGVVSRFSIENFLSHTAENFRRGESFSVSLISGNEKFYASEGYVTIFDFLSNLFCLPVPKNLVGEPSVLCFINFGYRKSLDKRGGVSTLSVENSGSHSAEKFRGHPFNVSEKLGYRKILCIIGGITNFRRKFLSHSAEKFRGNPLNVSENLGYRKILWIIGGITSFRRKFFVSQCRKI